MGTLGDFDNMEIVDTELEEETGWRYTFKANDVIFHYLDVDSLDDVDTLQELKVEKNDHL